MKAASITGLLLAGGRGQRMGNRDKGLMLLAGRPLAAHVLARLKPQVGQVLISANRNAADYAALGPVVLPDAGSAGPDFDGPLAGMLAGLKACSTEWLQCVACDTPLLPRDLVKRLAASLQQHHLAALPRTQEAGRAQWQMTSCLLHRSVVDSLAVYLDRGERRVEAWLRGLDPALIDFDTRPFANANTPQQLAALEAML
ncbi:MAG TPA: molybdenum cofactor guanylyltransferase MobA [Burkholderiaceae bacterium]